MSNTRYKRHIQLLSMKIVKAQAPIRILDAIKWDPSHTRTLLQGNRTLPKITADYYRTIPLGFDLSNKAQELKDIRQSILRLLGKSDAVGKILIRNCKEYEEVVRMLGARGTPAFYESSKRLYGSSTDTFADNRTRISEMGNLLDEILKSIHSEKTTKKYPKSMTAQKAVDSLNDRLLHYFRDRRVRVKLDDGIVSDAAAGSDYIKVRRGAKFSIRDVSILEVHEGWVHVGSTLNGTNQPYAKWLAKGPPCTTSVQEGLAVLMEIISFVSLPDRAIRINNRVLACEMAEKGADVFDIIDFYVKQGHSFESAVHNSQRVLRGGMLTGSSPFTKDIVYCKGFVMVYNFMRSAIRFGRPELVPFIFAGKLALDDIPVLYRLHQEGVVEAPRYLPPQFSDLSGLSVWMAFSNFLNRMDLEKIQKDFRRNFSV